MHCRVSHHQRYCTYHCCALTVSVLTIGDRALKRAGEALMMPDIISMPRALPPPAALPKSTLRCAILIGQALDVIALSRADVTSPPATTMPGN
jgi:hypothetical protein